MATKIVTKNSSTASAVPTASDLVQGELAVNVADKKLFTEDNSGAIIELADGVKLAGIEASADVTDTANVTAAGALMDSELTSIASVKALNQGVATTDSPAFAGLTVDTTTLAVDATNNRVGIGTSSPSEKLQVDGNIRIGDTATGTDDDEEYSITSGGQLIISANDSAADVSYSGLILNAGKAGGAAASSSLVMIKTNDTERMRIDSSGRVGIGTASPSSLLTISGAEGSMIQLQESGTDRGAIGIKGNEIFITDAVAGLRMSGSGTNNVIPCNAVGNGTDNATDLGGSSNRFDDIYATNGTIQTSDRNEKQDIAELSEVEQRVAVACKGLLRKFRWKDSVAKKGDDARIHFGIIAQDLQAAFAAEGLDAGNYAMFISTTWWEQDVEVPAVEAAEAVYETQTDDEGNETQVLIDEAVEAVDAYTETHNYPTIEEAPEGATEKTRLGVRYSELLAFIISAL